ncbi:MAG: helix-turn-helix domain-containing protein, partial [Candidatus Hermodarchaeota archaeon]
QRLAELAGVSRQTIYYLETAKEGYNPSLALSLKISSILNKSIEDLFYFEPVIRDILGLKTIDELKTIAEFSGISMERILQLIKISDNQLTELYTLNELEKISKVLGMDFEELFEE